MTSKKQDKPKNNDLLTAIVKDEIEKMAKFYKPRDPARIDKIMSVISELWKLQPDTRLGQLMLIGAFRDTDHRDKTSIEMWAQEDDLTLENLSKLLKSEKARLAAKSKYR
jgi:hypothetical protein